MLRSICKQIRQLTAAMAAVFMIAPLTIAAGDMQLGCIHCPHCQACCTLKAEKVDQERSCWEVECEEICIPRVVFPWQRDCCNPSANNGAVVRKVKRLKAKSYTCPACKYTWEPSASQRRACGCSACCGQSACGCGEAACDDTRSGAVPFAPAPLPAQQNVAPEYPPAAFAPSAALPVHVQPFYGQPVYAQPAWPQGVAPQQPVIAAPQPAAY